MPINKDHACTMFDPHHKYGRCKAGFIQVPICRGFECSPVAHCLREDLPNHLLPFHIRDALEGPARNTNSEEANG